MKAIDSKIWIGSIIAWLFVHSVGWSVGRRHTFDSSDVTQAIKYVQLIQLWVYFDCLWTLFGMSLYCLWTVSGLSLDCLWTVSGLFLDFFWNVSVLSLYCPCTVSGLSLDCLWTVSELSLDCSELSLDSRQ